MAAVATVSAVPFATMDAQRLAFATTAQPVSVPQVAPTQSLPNDPTLFSVDASKSEQLRAIFPEVEAEVLTQLLAFHDNNVEQVVDLLLDVGVTDASEERADAEMARSIQQEQDEQMARAIAASMTQETPAGSSANAANATNAASEANRATSRVVSIASLRAKKFLMQRMRGRSQTSTSARLLDASDEADKFDTAPLQVPLAVPSYAPPAVTTEAPSEAGRSTTEAALYNARLDRARSANRVRSNSRLPVAAAPPAAGWQAQEAPNTLAQAPVPEGELI